MARLAGVDIPRDKRVEIALTYIYGVGRTRSQQTPPAPPPSRARAPLLSNSIAIAPPTSSLPTERRIALHTASRCSCRIPAPQPQPAAPLPPP